MGESRSSPRRVRAAQRHRAFLGLRAEGLSYQAIADRMGVSKTRARAIVDSELERVRAVTAEEATALKRKQLEEYRQLKAAWWGKAMGFGDTPDKDAANVVLKALAQEARLAGLDAPQRTQAEVGPLGEMSEAELDEQLRLHANVFKAS